MGVFFFFFPSFNIGIIFRNNIRLLTVHELIVIE